MKVILTGDWHIGAETVEAKEIERIKNRYWLAKPMILMGDLIDAGLDRGMQFSQNLNPTNQINTLKGLLKGLDIRTCLIGNHEIRFFKTGGIDLYSVLDYPEEHYIEIDGCEFYVTHGKSTARNPLVEFNKLFEFVDTDIIAIGHNHTLLAYNMIRKRRRVVLVRTGSFLGSAVYSNQNGYAPRISGWVEVDTKKRTAQCYELFKGRVMKI